MERMEQRVWQRVGGGQPMELEKLARLARENAVQLRLLAEKCSGETGKRMACIARSAAYAAQVTAGLLHLQQGQTPPQCQGWPERHLSAALAQAVQRSRALWQAYDAQSAAGEFRHVFCLLAAREQQITADLLTLLGGK